MIAELAVRSVKEDNDPHESRLTNAIATISDSANCADVPSSKRAISHTPASLLA